jgi:sulfur-carrier protein
MAASAQPGACIQVRLFASLREATGWSEQLVTPATTTRTPLALWQQLELGPGEPPAGVRVAINQQFASWDAPLADGDELAFLPPISGG